MEWQSSNSRNTGVWYLCAGAGIFTSALAYYVVFRSQLPWPGNLVNLEWARLSLLADQSTDFTRGSYPSFAFTLSMGLVAIGLFVTQRSTIIKAILGIWAIGLIHEIFISIFTVIDVLAGTLGAMVALRIAMSASRVSLHSVPTFFTPESKAARQLTTVKSDFCDRAKLTLLMLSSIAFATGTSPHEETFFGNCIEFDVNGTCINTYDQRTPTYMSYADLRSAVKVSEPRALTSVSRIYLYNNYIFANELNEGIHIIDNSTPSTPKRLGFIEIPGNLDIAIRDNALYADSYIDLVTLDLSDMENIYEVSRVEGVFPYNSRQNIPDNVRLSGNIDKSLGVVVGYR